VLELALWPNPAKDVLNISINERNYAGYTITNLLGKKIIEGTLRNAQVDIANLSAGLYLFTLNNKDNSSTIRFVVED